MEKEIEETKEKLEENEKKEETKEEKEIKDLKEKNKRLKDENKLLKDSINNRETKFKNKLLKLIVLYSSISPTYSLKIIIFYKYKKTRQNHLVNSLYFLIIMEYTFYQFP